MFTEAQGLQEQRESSEISQKNNITEPMAFLKLII